MVLILIVLFYAFAAVNSQNCICNLIEGICEVNCCCDLDCTDTEVVLFSYCININTNTSTLLCNYNEIVFVNTTATAVAVEEEGLFCLVSDQFTDRHSFIEPSCAPANCLDGGNRLYTFASSHTTLSTGTFYQAGDSIFVQYSNNSDRYFSTPSSGFSAMCQDYDVVEFLEVRSVSCSRNLPINQFGSICTSFFDYETYSNAFEIYSVPPESTQNPTLVSLTVSCIVNGVTGNCEKAVPDSVTNTCQFAVISASYVLVSSGVSGIISANVSFVLEDVQVAVSPVTQTFSVRFRSGESLLDKEPVSNSGNPGYVVGRPLLTAVRQQTDSTASVVAISQNSELGLEMSMVDSDGSGLCDVLSRDRLPVLFAVNQRSGCQLSVNYDCAAMGIAIQNTLDSFAVGSFNGMGLLFVGTYGNSNIDNLLQYVASDWVQVVRENYPAASSIGTSGCMLSLNSNYEILFANSAAITNPQSKIVGVRYGYSVAEFLSFRCPNASCSQLVEIFTSVDFVDISSSPESIERTRRTLQARTPADFYFPFRN